MWFLLAHSIVSCSESARSSICLNQRDLRPPPGPICAWLVADNKIIKLAQITAQRTRLFICITSPPCLQRTAKNGLPSRGPANLSSFAKNEEMVRQRLEQNAVGDDVIRGMDRLDRLVWPVVRSFFRLPVVSFFGQPKKFVADLFAETEHGTTGPGEELRLPQAHIDMQVKLLIKNLPGLGSAFHSIQRSGVKFPAIQPSSYGIKDL